MIECARCGYRNDAAAKFCAACGAPMFQAQAAPVPPAMPAAAPAQGYSPAWGNPPGQPQPPPNWGPQQWGAPAPPMSPPNPAAQWAPPQPLAAQPGAPAPAPSPYAPPPWGGAVAPEAVAPAWGQPGGQPGWSQEGVSATPDHVPLPPAPAAPPVVPTAASAVISPLEADQVPANAPRTLSAFLVTFENDPLGEFWPLHQGRNVVGRKGSGAELHLEIDHPTTSSRHAVVHAAARPGRLKVEDLGSTNGTFVNERRLENGERRALEPGDTLRFGGFSVTVILV